LSGDWETALRKNFSTKGTASAVPSIYKSEDGFSR
jgi:hypothetical protein